MSKKILILNGSPRKNGNTASLCDEFVKGAESAGHTVNRFDLRAMDIHGCIGCLKGGKDPSSPCVQKDDMEKVYPAFQEADIVVLASPMYYWSFTSQLKAAFDRLYAVTEAESAKAGGYTVPRKDCMLLMAAEDNSEANWKPVLDYYRSMTGHLEWKDCGMVLAGGVMQVGDIKDKPFLEEARALGASIA